MPDMSKILFRAVIAYFDEKLFVVIWMAHRVDPKCIWKAVVYCNHIEENSPLKCILTVPTKCPKCFVSELQPFNFFNSSNETPCSIFFLQQLLFYYHFSRGLMTDLRIGSPMMASPLSGSIPITIEEAVSLKSLLLGSSCKPFPNGWLGMKPAVLPTCLINKAGNTEFI